MYLFRDLLTVSVAFATSLTGVEQIDVVAADVREIATFASIFKRAFDIAI